MKRLSLYLLGPYNVTLDGAPVTDFRSDKVRALLAYLGVETGRPHRRDALAGLLWPDVPDSTARNNLRLSLHRLREALDDLGTESAYFDVTRETLQLKPDAAWVDTAVFDRLVEGSRSHTHPQRVRCPSCMNRLQEASDHYRGEFLQGFFLEDSLAFSEWTLLKREWLHRQALWALYQLTACYQGRGELDRAAQCARRQLELEPWREEAYRQLMEVLARQGATSAALAQYETCRRILAAELQIEPDHETDRLCDQIRLMRVGPEHNLPPQATPFVGRDRELAQIADMLDNPDCRLITIFGPGGIGKTRLAVQAALAAAGRSARTFLHGVTYVPLAGVESARSLVPAIARALDLPLHRSGAPDQQLLGYLRQREMLLVLDNLDHLIASSEFLVELLEQAPGVKLLVTSRQRLNLHWEWLMPVDGLSYPKEGDAITEGDAGERYEAVRLFQTCAWRVQPDLQLEGATERAVIQLCQMVEGMPLGIELAAAWAGTMPVTEILREFTRDLDLSAAATRSMPARHRSLRAVFDHSWQRLTPPEQKVLSQLSAFRGGFDGLAALQVAGASPAVVQSLVDKSLLRMSVQNRYEMHELLRQYAAERLASVPEVQTAVLDRHCAYYSAFLEYREGDFNQPGATCALANIDIEMANIRAAWHRAAGQGRFECVAQALPALAEYYRLKGPLQEGAQLIETAIARVRELAEPGEATPADGGTVLSRLLVAHAGLLNGQGLCDAALASAQAAIGLAEAHRARELEAAAHLEWGQALWRQGMYAAARDRFEKALCLAQAAHLPRVEATSLRSLGVLCFDLGDWAGARAYYEQALELCRASDDRRGEGALLNNLGLLLWNAGEYARARTFLEQALASYRGMGDRHTEGVILLNLGRVAIQQCHYGEARTYLQSALDLSREVGDRVNEGWCLLNLGRVAFDQNTYGEAQSYCEQALRVFRAFGTRQGQGIALVNLGGIACEQGEYAQAEHLLAQALDICREIGDRQGESWALSYLGNVFHAQGAMGQARAFRQDALRLNQELGDRDAEGWELAKLALLAHQLGDDEAAAALGRQALAKAQELGNPSLESAALTQLGHAFTATGQLERAAEAYRRSLDIRRRLGQAGPAAESMAGLARVCLARGDQAQALAYAESVLPCLAQGPATGHGLWGADEPLRVYLTCYQILQAGGDPRAHGVLHTAHQLLQKQAASIADAGLRRSFLENLPAHREIVEGVTSNGNA